MKNLKNIGLSFLMLLTGTIAVYAQAGFVRDSFVDGKPSNWKANTKGSTAEVKGNKLVVTPVLQEKGDYRGDLGTKNFTLAAGTYPIVALKVKGLGKAKIVFDTNLGTYKGSFTKIAQKDGSDVFYIDLTKNVFKKGNDSTTTTLSVTEPTVFKSVNVKIPGIKYSEEQVEKKEATFDVIWMRTYATEAELKANIK